MGNIDSKFFDIAKKCTNIIVFVLFNVHLIIIINIAANKRETIGASEDEMISDDKLFLKSVTKDTPFTNKFDTIQKRIISAWTSPPTFLFLYNHNFKERTKRKLIYAR